MHSSRFWETLISSRRIYLAHRGTWKCSDLSETRNWKDKCAGMYAFPAPLGHYSLLYDSLWISDANVLTFDVPLLLAIQLWARLSSFSGYFSRVKIDLSHGVWANWRRLRKKKKGKRSACNWFLWGRLFQVDTLRGEILPYQLASKSNVLLLARM